jgi:hypothetical protein
MTRVHIIWDNSNIFLCGRSYCGKKERKESQFRTYFENLIDLAADGRQVEQVFCVGSVPPPTDSVWGHIETKTGKKPELYERGAASGKEQAVDQALQTRMLRLGYDYDPPETISLLSGDGSGHEYGMGFFSDVKRLHSRGWRIEIVAWRDNCARVMREWAEANGVFIDLGEFYSKVTFLQGGLRNAKHLDLSKRPH